MSRSVVAASCVSASVVATDPERVGQATAEAAAEVGDRASSMSPAAIRSAARTAGTIRARSQRRDDGGDERRPRASMPPTTAAATRREASRNAPDRTRATRRTTADRGQQPQGSEEASHGAQPTVRTALARAAGRYRRSVPDGPPSTGRSTGAGRAAPSSRAGGGAPCYTPPVPAAAGAPASRPAGVEPSSEVGAPVPDEPSGPTHRPRAPPRRRTQGLVYPAGPRRARRGPFFIARRTARGAAEGGRRCRQP